MTILFKIIRNNLDFYCTANDGPKYFVGRKVPYQGNIGLYNVFRGSPLQKLAFDAANYGPDFGFWVEFIAPTAACEGGSFLTINTYDRAAFTFGFTQFAAHVPDGDFVKYLRVLLARPEAVDYFPGLELVDGRIVRNDGHGIPVQLENAQTTKPLMAYLNPSSDDVEDQEVIAAAKLIHWSGNHREARIAQIDEMVRVYQGFMASADRRKLIDGRTADQCCVIADILHQGRGGSMTWTLVGNALQASKPLDALLAIGASHYGERIATLRAAIKANPNMAKRHWNSAAANFV